MRSHPDFASRPAANARFIQVLCGGLLVLLVFLAYLPSLRGTFLWDDNANVTDSLPLRSLDGLRRIWLEPGATQQYYPVTYTTFWIDWHLFGLNPFGYRVVNLLLHTLAALVMWRLLKALGTPGSWLGAVLFALHPVCVESVAWITERKNTLSAVFFFGSLLAATRFWQSAPCAASSPRQPAPARAREMAQRRGPWKFYFVSLLLYAAALSSKTSTVGLPVVILMLLWWRRAKPGWRGVLLLCPFFALGLAMGLITMHVEKSMVTAGEYWSFPAVERCVIVGKDVWFYLGKLIWPHPLAFFYPRWSTAGPLPWEYLPLAGAALGIAFLWRKRDTWGRPGLFVLGYFVVMLFPVLGLLNVSFFQFSFVADHLQYLACAAPLALAAAVIANGLDMTATEPPLLKQAVACALIMGLSALTWCQSRTYRDPETLWRGTLANNPGSWTAHYNLGSTLAARGEYQGALHEYEAAAQMDPNPAYAHFSLGNFQTARGNLDDAVREYTEVLSLKPNFTKVHNNLGNVLFRKGESAKAEQEFRAALQIEPQNADAHYNLGNTLAAEGKIGDAIQQYHSALELDPEYAYAHFNLANVLTAGNDLKGAIEEYRRTLHIDPENSEAHYNLGNALSAEGLDSDAISEYTEALRVRPDYIEALYNRGNVQAKSGALDKAIEDYGAVLKIRPDFAQAHFNLGNFFAAKGLYSRAREEFNSVLRLKPDDPQAHQQLQAVAQAEAASAK